MPRKKKTPRPPKMAPVYKPSKSPKVGKIKSSIKTMRSTTKPLGSQKRKKLGFV